MASTLARHGLTAQRHYQLQQYGVKKRQHEDFDPEQAATVLQLVLDESWQLHPYESHPIHRNAANRITVAITGASGAVYGVRLLQVLREYAGRGDAPGGVRRRLAQCAGRTRLAARGH